MDVEIENLVLFYKLVGLEDVFEYVLREGKGEEEGEEEEESGLMLHQLIIELLYLKLGY